MLQQRSFLLIGIIQFFDEYRPYFSPLRCVEGLEADGYVDAGLEGLVDVAGAVGGEEEDPVEIFEFPEEDGD